MSYEPWFQGVQLAPGWRHVPVFEPTARPGDSPLVLFEHEDGRIIEIQWGHTRRIWAPCGRPFGVDIYRRLANVPRRCLACPYPAPCTRWSAP